MGTRLEYKGFTVFRESKKAVAAFAKELDEMGEEAAVKYLDDLLGKSLDDYINAQDFRFLKLGYKFTHSFTLAKDGVKEIIHYLVSESGTKIWQGISTISEEGKLFNMFEVSLQKQEVSVAVYKLLDKIGFETIEASYGSGSLSSNFKEFMKVYNISNDAVEAAYSTPAGRAIVNALDNKYKPVDIVITENKVKMYWIKK